VISRKQLLSFWPDVLGIGALVLPFTHGVSPLAYFTSYDGTWEGRLVVAVLFLAIPIAAWQALRILRPLPTRFEQTVAYTLSIVSVLSPVVSTVSYVVWDGVSSADVYLYEAMGVALALIVAITLLLLNNLRSKTSKEVIAGAFLFGGYLPGAAILLVNFNFLTFGWEIGAYFVLATCIGYVLRIISLMRHGTKAYRPEESSG
jgi:hypothetical protein